jgi:cell pole-organizing protein PopZ
MSEQNSQEPTMEEILASIRRIISEDDAPVAEASAAESPVAAEPAAEDDDALLIDLALDDEESADEEEVLELTDRLDEPSDSLEIGDIEASPAPAYTRPEPAPQIEREPLVGGLAASTAASAFGALERSVLMPAGGRTLEDVVREMLRPMLKAWLDENLPAIVEAQVQAEVERISRQRR